MSRRPPVVILSGDADTQDLYVYALRSSRRPVYGLSAPEEVIALAQDSDLEAIIVDVRDLQGWQVCRQLRQSRATRRVPLVVLTGFVVPQRRYRELALSLGCAAFIAKPALPDALLNVLDRIATGERRIEEMWTAQFAR